jgi:hypothetical protein
MSGAGNRQGTPEEVTPVDRGPTYLSSALALVAGAIAAVTSASSLVAVAAALTGGVVLVAGLGTGRRVLVRLAGVVLVGAALIASGTGTAVLGTLVGVTTALLAVDLGTTAIDIGAQLGRQTPTARVELLHALTSTLVGFGFILTGAAADAFVAGSQPVSAVFGLVVAIILLVVALRRADPVG